jgi:hypothetical protein
VRVDRGDTTLQELKAFIPDGKGAALLDPKLTSTDADYGYATKSPIKVGSREDLGGPRASRAYLDSLRDENGEPVQYRRVGSVGGSPDGNVLDLYEVTTAAGKTLKLYVDMYHPRNEPADQPAPKGLYKSKR